MPRDSSGNYTLPAGNPVISGTVITSNWANTTMPDIGNALTDSLSRTGQGGMLVPMTFVDGSVSTPGIAFSLEPGLGWYRPSTSVMGLAVLGKDGLQYDGVNEILSVLGQVRVTEPAPVDDADLTRKDYVDVKVNRAGDTMGGQLNGLEPVDPENMATKNYVDSLIQGGGSQFVLKAGDTMTGQLIGITPLAAGDLTRKDYVDGLIAGVGGSVTDRVFRTGDTMTGQLNGLTPVDDANFTRKDYVDQLIAGIGGSVTDRVLRAGDTMTGQLEGITPVDPADMTRKDYVDGQVGLKVNKTGDTMTGQLVLPGGGTGNDAAIQSDVVSRQLLSEKGAPNGYCPLNASGLVPVPLLPINNVEFLGGWDASGNTLPPTPAVGGSYYIITADGTLNVVPADGSSPTPTPTAVLIGQDIIYSDITLFWYQVVPNTAANDARYLQLAGGTMTGQVNGISPVAAANLTRRDYVDNAVALRLLLTGGTMTGQIIGVTPLSNGDLTRKDYVDGALAAGDALKVSKSGDTMTGQLNGITPSAAANLTRKDYVDSGVNNANSNASSRVARSGDTMTGSLNGVTPTAAANLTRKDYVDLNKLNTDFLRTGDRLDITNVPT